MLDGVVWDERRQESREAWVHGSTLRGERDMDAGDPDKQMGGGGGFQVKAIVHVHVHVCICVYVYCA